MKATNIPHDVLAQTALLNSIGGATQAWAYLAHKGYQADQIFAILDNIERLNDTDAPMISI